MESGRAQKPNRWRRSIIVGIAILVAVVVGLAIFLAVYLTRDKDTEPPTTPQTQTDDAACDVNHAIDVAVIGAGISGAYTAWRLRDQGLSVSLYEYTDRVGGRLHTVQLPGIPDVNVELGGMRFLLPYHPLVNGSAHDLGLPVVDFAPGFGFSDSAMLYLRRTHVTRGAMDGDTAAYNLKHAERKYPYQLKWELYHNQTFENAAAPDDFLARVTHDGSSLYNQSVPAAYHAMGASSEAVLYLRDSMGFHSYYGDVAAALTVPAADPTIHRHLSVMTVGAGMQALPTSMVQQFLTANHRHALKMNHKLEAIHNKKNGVYELVFDITETTSGYTKIAAKRETRKVCARKVVLTVPRYSLERVTWEGFNDRRIRRYITKSVRDAPAAKVFLSYDHAWWRDVHLNFTHSVSDLPNRQTYDFGTSQHSRKSVLLVAYTDMEDAQFWRDLQTRGAPIPGADHAANHVTDTVVRHAHAYLAELYNVTVGAIPAPLGGVMSLWDVYPYGAAWHTWRPGFDWGEVGRAMIQPAPGHRVYLATGSFAQGEGSAWVDNALQTVEQMLPQLLAS